MYKIVPLIILVIAGLIFVFRGLSGRIGIYDYAAIYILIVAAITLISIGQRKDHQREVQETEQQPADTP